MNNNIKEIKIDAGTREFLFTRDECIVIRGVLNSLISDGDVPQTSQSSSVGEHIDSKGLVQALREYRGYLDDHKNIMLL